MFCQLFSHDFFGKKMAQTIAYVADFFTLYNSMAVVSGVAQYEFRVVHE